MTKKIFDASDLSVWKSNMNILHSSQPELAKRLDEWVEEHGHAFEHDELSSENGTWVQGLSDRPFFQEHEPESLSWRKNERISVLFIHGVGTPPWLFKQLRSVPKDLLALIVIEPDLNLLAYTLHMTHVYHAIPAICRLSFVTSHKERDIEEALKVNLSQMGTYAAADAKAIKHIGETNSLPEQFEKLWGAIRERIVLKLSELGNSAEDTLLGLRQIALVSPWFAYGSSLNAITDKFKGRPFVWVASGPSLDKNFQLLKENNNRAVIICADSALKKLLGAGIIPHIVVALERGLYVEQMFAENRQKYHDKLNDVLLVVQAVCVTDVVAKWPGPKVVVGKLEIPVDQWLIGQIVGGDLLLSGLSVAHMALQLANALEASSVALIGQDLAYGENFTSHAGATVADWVRAEEKSRAGDDAIMIPGALGGEVRTTSVWLSFLRIIERYMVHFSFKMFDCTEGGALIDGAEIKTFREWIDDTLIGFEPMDETPAQAVTGRKLSPEQIKESVAKVIERSQNGFEFIKRTHQMLDEIEKDIEKVIAPALSPSVRQRFAYEMSDKFDRLHASNPVIEFVGQSITTLNAANVARTRFLDSVAMVEEWEATHREIVVTHRTSLGFMEKWLRYTVAALTVFSDGGGDISIETLPSFASDEVIDISEFENDIKARRAISLLNEIMNAENDEKAVKAHAMLDNLIARADTKWWRFWDPRIDWKVALSLEVEGRIQEAIEFMRRMEKFEMGVVGMAGDEAAVFLRDMARILATRDLCHFPNYDEARVYAQNAIELAKGDDELLASITETLKFINDRSSEHLSSVEGAIIAAGSRKDDINWLKFERNRLLAEKALADGDVMEALMEVWKLISENYPVMPQKVLPFWEWLETHLIRFDEAGYDMGEGVFKGILAQLIPLMPQLTRSGFSLSDDFLGFLERRGMKFELEGMPKANL